MHRRVIVGGRVQGVGFRWFVREHARTLRLSGWVRNLPDGRVELEVEGADEGVGELMELVSEGPDGAVVGAIEDQPIEAGDELPNPFTILR